MRIALVCLVLALGCRETSEVKVASENQVKPPQAESPKVNPKVNPNTREPVVSKKGTVDGSAKLMGTKVTIRVFLDPGREASEASEAIASALKEMDRIEKLMSEWLSDSELSRLNQQAGGAPMKIGADLAEVLVRARTIAEKSGGAFDPTFHGVGKLWSFKPGAVPPSAQEIAANLPLVNWQLLEVDAKMGTARLSKAGMMVGLGAIAKGYAVDRASRTLGSLNFHNHIVEAGGDTYASGSRGGNAWMIGVANPDSKGYHLGVIPSVDLAVVTSGDYESFFEYEGKRYAHIIDPRTGWPLDAKESAQSVTIVAPNATDADAMATAATVLGSEHGMALIEANAGFEAVIMTRDGKLLVSTGLKSKFVAIDQSTGKATTP